MDKSQKLPLARAIFGSVLVAAFKAPSSLVLAGYDKGEYLYDTALFTSALGQWTTYGSDGDSGSWFNSGYRYSLVQGVPQYE